MAGVRAARVALRSIGRGKRLRDKLGIVARLAVYALFPLGIAARKLGHPLPEPTRWLGELTVRGPAGAFVCPPGPSPFFLGVDASFEPGLCALLEQLRGGTVLDVGANIGFITVRAARAVGSQGRVIAIEPHPERFHYLERNIALNDLTNVTCVQCAIGAEKGRLTLFDVDPTLGPRPLDVSIQPGRGTEFEVPMRTLDELLDELGNPPDISLVKIDVEGYESDVLAGMPRLLSTRPRLVVEVLGGATAPSSVSSLLPTGYVVREIDPNNWLAEPVEM